MFTEYKYNVLYVHSGMNEEEGKSTSDKKMTISEIRADVGEHTITEMKFTDEVPDSLYSIAPNLTKLKLWYVNRLPPMIDR